MKTVKRVYKKKVHKKEHNADLHALALAMIAIVACMVSLCGASWAWFTASTATGTAAIRSATFSIDGVTITSSTGASEVENNNGKYTATLKAGSYTLKFKADASNTANGYCVITVTADGETAGTPYYTEKLKNSDPFSLALETRKKVVVSIEPRWGNIPEQASPLTSNGAILIAGTPVESKPATQSSTPKAQAVTPPVSTQSGQTASEADKAKPETDKTESENGQAAPEADKTTSSAGESN